VKREPAALLRRALSGALATALADDGGRPYVSLVTVGLDLDGSPIFLFSDLSDHTKNLASETRASLLVEEASRHANPQTAPRVTLVGRIDRDEAPRLRRRFLARHPSASLYAGFADFHVFRMTIERVHYVGGFGRARWLGAAGLLADRTAADALAGCEEDVLARMNGESAEAVELMAVHLLHRRGRGWQMIGLDPAGADFRRGATFARLAFPRPATDADSLAALLAEQAEEAQRRAAAAE
jgi:putative heme iron utilization protein